MSSVLYILAAIFVFGMLVAVHELGHFLAAKACGVRVNEFSIGMGPEIWSKVRGETQYSLRALPIGGFCAMEGEDEESDDERSLGKQGFWKKLIIFAAGAGMNLVTGFLILLLLYSSAEGFRIPAIAGSASEFEQNNGVTLEADDVFWKINGERVYLYSDVDLLLGLNPGQPLDLVVLRDGKKVELNDLKFATYTDQQGESYQGYGIFRDITQWEEANLGTKLKTSWYNTVSFVRVVRLSLKMLFVGDAGVDDLSGPVGIVSTMTEVGEQAQEMGGVLAAIESILYFAAMLTVNLAVMNLLPLPALDGGKIFFLILNAVAMLVLKKKVPDRFENYIHLAGLALLMLLMLAITFKDVWALFV